MGLLRTAIGAGVGFMIGGPTGAMMGAQIMGGGGQQQQGGAAGMMNMAIQAKAGAGGEGTAPPGTPPAASLLTEKSGNMGRYSGYNPQLQSNPPQMPMQRNSMQQNPGPFRQMMQRPPMR